MKLIKFVLLTVIGLAVILGVAGLFLPDSAHVERSVTIDAPASEVFDLLNDMSRFNDWSPWYGEDPNAVYTLTGPASGVGSKMAWASELRSVGSGSMEITASQPNDRVETYLDFGDQGDAAAYYALSESGGQTTVTWGFDTEFHGNIVQRYFGLMLDTFVGTSYEDGLAKLKVVAES
ncbi:MAG: SRPBCC family protein [Pseudomonadota bacterium]